MNKYEIIKFCKDLGCCDACCLRYLGLKNPAAYENTKEFILKYQNTDNPEENVDTSENSTKEENNVSEVGSIHSNGAETSCAVPPAKRCKTEGICVSCIGVLQDDTWPQCYSMVEEVLQKKRYECKTFACGLSAPMVTILREKIITLQLCDKFPDYDVKCVMPLKEAWKWSFGCRLATRLNITLDSGCVAPLLITLNMDYPQEMQELEILKSLSPSLFESRSKQRRRFAVEFTRRSVEQALSDVTWRSVRDVTACNPLLPPAAAARCVSAVCTHTPLYLGGRYIKMSRNLPQTPWLVGGERMMESSVQEIIFQPIAQLYNMSASDAERRLKLLAAGREDVDVRCLGDGRPFAVQIADPCRQLSEAELRTVCEQISASGDVLVHSLVYVTKEQLALLKEGEASKCKTYEALCIKLSHCTDEPQASGDIPVSVTSRDIANINSYSNTGGADARIALRQRTPLRVLHRRPLLARSRRILRLSAAPVPGHPALVLVRVVTEAGTYVKEWAHGDAGRTAPCLGDAVRARADILALDVVGVHLAWPPREHEGGSPPSAAEDPRSKRT